MIFITHLDEDADIHTYLQVIRNVIRESLSVLARASLDARGLVAALNTTFPAWGDIRRFPNDEGLHGYFMSGRITIKGTYRTTPQTSLGRERSISDPSPVSFDPEKMIRFLSRRHAEPFPAVSLWTCEFGALAGRWE